MTTASGPIGKKTRLMWLIDEWGLNKFGQKSKTSWVSRWQRKKKMKSTGKSTTLVFILKKQPGLNYVGLHIPVGRLYAQDMFDLARIAEVYGSSEIHRRENLIIPNSRTRAWKPSSRTAFGRFSINPDT